MTFEIIKLKERKYPLCPECGKATIVGFTPPKEGSNLPTSDINRWDFERASLYCCNASTNCKFNTRYLDLTTPLTEPK